MPSGYRTVPKLLLNLMWRLYVSSLTTDVIHSQWLSLTSFSDHFPNYFSLTTFIEYRFSRLKNCVDMHCNNEKNCYLFYGHSWQFALIMLLIYLQWRRRTFTWFCKSKNERKSISVTRCFHCRLWRCCVQYICVGSQYIFGILLYTWQQL